MRGIIKALTVICLVSLSANTYASDGKGYNGSYCKSYHGNQISSFRHGSYGIKNKSTRSRYISCPIIVDQVGTTSGSLKTWIHYTGNGTISCNLLSKNGTGSTKQSRSGSRTNTGWLSITDLTSDDRWGSYMLYCKLPAGGVLNTIHIDEK